MSNTEYKMVLRAQLQVSSAYQLYQVISAVAGPPTEKDYDPEYPNAFYFTYKPGYRDGDDVAKYAKPWYQECYSSGVYGVDLVLNHEDGGVVAHGCTTYSVDQLVKYRKKLCKDFCVKPADVNLMSYSWYNGVDEPVDFW